MLGHIEMKASFKTTSLYGSKGNNFKEWPTGIQINKWTRDELKEMRISKVEWCFDNKNDINMLKSLRFTLTSGEQSPIFGDSSITKLPSSFVISKKTKIRKIQIFYFGTYGIELFDQSKKSVLKIGSSHPEFKEVNLGEDTFFIGAKSIGKEKNKYIDCLEIRTFKVPKIFNK